MDRNERVGPWDTSVWSIDTLEVINKTRIEHLEANPPPPVQEDNPEKTEPEPEEEESEDEDEKIRKYEAGEWGKQEEISKSKKALRELAKFRPTLDPPTPSKISYEEFFAEGKEKEYIHVGRELKLEQNSRSYQATLWMHDGQAAQVSDAKHEEIKEKDTAAAATYSLFPTIVQATPTPPPSIQSKEFPITIQTVYPLLELIGMGTNEHVRSLKEFFNVQLPPGFPGKRSCVFIFAIQRLTYLLWFIVQIEIPIGMLPLSAVVTFQNISTTYPIDQNMFSVPGKKQGYRVGEVVKGSDGRQLS